MIGTEPNGDLKIAVGRVVLARRATGFAALTVSPRPQTIVVANIFRRQAFLGCIAAQLDDAGVLLFRLSRFGRGVRFEHKQLAH